MSNETVVRVTADASGYVSELDKAKRSAQSFLASQEEAARRTQAAQAAVAEAVANSSDASARKINAFMQSLARQAETAGKSRAELLKMQAATLGISGAAQPYIEKLAAATAGTHELSLGTAGARRELLVLGHEMITGNWSRFGGSLMVLGERTDAMSLAFSGAGAAAIAAAGGVAALVAAIGKGAAESAEFNKQLQLTGNFAGVTEGQFNALSKSLAGELDAKIGSTRQAIQELIATGRFSGDALRSAGAAAVEFSKATGASAEDVVKDFVKMSDGVAKWAEEQNRQYHFLTGAQYEHITLLEQEGAKQAAMQATMDALTNHVKTHVENVGYLEGAWHKAAEAFSKYWDGLKNIGRDTTIDDQIAQAQKDLAGLQLRAKAAAGTREGDRLSSSIAGVQGYLDQLKARKDLQEMDAKSASLANQLHENAIRAIDDNNALAKSMRTRAQQEQDEIKRYRDNVKAMIADGMQAPGADVQQKMIDAIKAKYDPKPAAQVSSDYERLKKSLSEYLAEQQMQLQGLEKLTEGQRLASKFVTDLRDGTIKMTDAEKARITTILDSIITDEKANKAKQDAAAASEQAQKAIERETAAVAAYKNTLSMQLSTAQNAADLSVATVGMGSDEAARYKRMNDLRKQYDDKYAQLVKLQQTHPEQADTYAKEIQALKDYQQQRMEIEATTYQRVKVAQADWQNGARKSFQDYLANAQNVAAQVSSAFTDGFNGMEDAIANFLQTGKLSFSGFAQSVLADLARIEAKAITSKILGGMNFGGLLSGLFGGGSAVGGLSGNAATIAGAVSGAGGILHFADGGDPPIGVPSLVGERGPELFVPKSAGTVIPNDALVGAGGQAITLNPTYNIKIDGSTDMARNKQMMAQVAANANAQLVDQLRRARKI